MVIVDSVERDRRASHALRRFGLGSRLGELASARSDPKGFVQAQLNRPSEVQISDGSLQSTSEILQGFEQGKLAARAKAQSRQGQSQSDASDGMPAAFRPGKYTTKIYERERLARFENGIGTQAPLLERLVQFWSNHFAVSARKVSVRGVAGAYEREVIRPNILGPFGQMLAAAESHPAMLLYLDGVNSIGPNSQAGRRQGRGLNENHAREILELHTVGVQGGYSQEDVTNFARILTGWNVGTIARDGPNAGSFVFLPRRHEPGNWQVLGRVYGGEGSASGFEVLSDLGRETATADYIARKLARHFVGDAVSTRLIQRLSAAFLDSSGNLHSVVTSLIDDDEAWQLPAAKVLSPYDFVVSLMRVSQRGISDKKLTNYMVELGQPVWSPPSPDGWPDEDLAWVSPLNLRGRFIIASKVARQMHQLGHDPREVASDLFGASLSGHTASAIARAESIPQGFELLFMSPEFQRR